MPIRFKKRDRGAVLPVHVTHQSVGVKLHGVFQFSAFAVERIELLRQFLCRDGVVREETFDTDAHFGESPCGVDARSNTEGEVARRSIGRITPGDFKKRVDAGAGQTAAHTIEALRDQDAVIVVKLHDIGDGSESNQIA